jgi:hypothetical protein
MLEAVKRLAPRPDRDKPARVVCLTAAAVDNDCLARQYADVPEQCETFLNLASEKDTVLRYAYPSGDFFSDLFGDNDSPWSAALGLRGPHGRYPANVRPSQIPKSAGYGHGDYMPPSAGTPPVSAIPPNSWENSTGFMIRAFREESQNWP